MNACDDTKPSNARIFFGDHSHVWWLFRCEVRYSQAKMAPDILVVAIEIGEPELADRLTALLADVPGLRLAAPGEPADAALVIPGEPEPGPDVGLTPRELDVLALIAEGASNKAIARRLAISIHTVKFHIASLLDKLDAQGRAEAVAQGARLGAIRL
jgi:DNA-binding CsgD family transcriptional regulator